MKHVPSIRYFKPSEFFDSPTAKSRGIVNWPCDFNVYSNILLLSFYFDYVRKRFSSPIKLTSGYRSPLLNKAVGGVNNSKHLQGLAVDIKILHNTDYEKIRQIIGNDCRFIKYYPDRHYMHVDFTQEFLLTFFNNQNSNAYEK